MNSYGFSCPGGELLTEIGASWFVSYAYYERVNNAHQNWKRVKTAEMRKNLYEKGRKYHDVWLEAVVKYMNPSNLGTNTIGLDGNEVKNMAKEILAI